MDHVTYRSNPRNFLKIHLHIIVPQHYNIKQNLSRRNVTNFPSLLLHRTRKTGKKGNLQGKTSRTMIMMMMIIIIIVIIFSFIWAGHVARMEEGRGVHKVLVGKPERKETTGGTNT